MEYSFCYSHNIIIFDSGVKMRKKSVFEDSTSGPFQALEVIIGLIVILIISWLSVNSPEIGPVVTGLWGLVVLTIGMWALDAADEKNRYAESIGFGNNKKNIRNAFIWGLIVAIGLIFLGSSSFVVVPFALTSMAFVAILAAFIEEMFFRSTLIPTLGRLFSNFKVLWGVYDYLAIAVGSILFGLFHVLAYGGNISFMIMAIIFSIVMVVGNWKFKSTIFGYTAHATYNFIIVYVLAGGLV